MTLRRALNLAFIIAGCLMHSPGIFAQPQKIDSLKIELTKASTDTTKVRILIQLSQALVSNDLKQANKYSEQAITLAANEDSWEIQADAISNSGKILFAAELYDLAAKRFYEVTNLEPKHENNLLVIYALFNLGTIRMILGQYDKAEEIQREAFDKLQKYHASRKEETPPDEIISFYSNMAYILTETKSNVKAMEFIDKGINLARKDEGQIQGLSKLLVLKGDVLINEGKFSDAHKVANEAFELNIKSNDLLYQSIALRSLGVIADELKMPLEALDFFKKGYNLAVKVESPALIKANSEQLHLLYKKLGEADSSLKYLTISTDYKSKEKFDQTKIELTRQEITDFFKKQSEEELKKHNLEIRRLFLILTLFIVLAGFLLYWYIIIKRKHRIAEQRKTKIEREAQKLESEKIILESDLYKKEKLLATQAIVNIQKNEEIVEMVEKLRSHHSTRNSDSDKKFIANIIQDLGRSQDENRWNEFEIRFKEVHPDFSSKLQKLHPNLTPNERRICEFLHLNMTSKEISAITTQSPQSLEVARTRLRKKLGITNQGIGLIEYLTSL